MDEGQKTLRDVYTCGHLVWVSQAMTALGNKSRWSLSENTSEQDGKEENGLSRAEMGF